jgi:ABC-type phosphate transport system ATPase subunit
VAKKIDEDFLHGLQEQYRILRDLNYELMVIGNTNVGKSTFLNTLTKMKDFFRTSTTRETSCIWRFRCVPDDQQVKPYVMRTYEIDPQSISENKEDRKRIDIYFNRTQLPEVGFTEEASLIQRMDEEMKRRRKIYRHVALAAERGQVIKNPQEMTPQELESLDREEEKRTQGAGDTTDGENLEELLLEVEITIRQSTVD